jgi:hypothetical protein
MDIKDKLDLLRKEREVGRRGRTDSVEDTWARLQREEDLSTKEKLERLIGLTGQRSAAKPKKPAPYEPLPREPIQFFENAFPFEARYGRLTIADGLAIKGEVLATLGRDESFGGLDLGSALFFDLETTGLAGGTGTVAFLVGMGFYRDGRFVVNQYFLGDLASEKRMILELGRFFEEMDFKSIVTYNGKAFDLPLMETRFILQRRPLLLSGLPHLDFLFAARALWKHKHDSCRLFHLAQQVVEAPRDEDIPGAEIPTRYFEYLRTGNFGLIEPILYHNQEDILSLLGLVISGAHLCAEGFAAGPDEAPDPLDLVGVGRVYESIGESERSAEIFERALTGRLPSEVAQILRHKLSDHFKKKGNWDKAVTLWRDLMSTDPLLCLEELAKYYEHRAKDLGEAKRFAEEGLALAMDLAPGRREEFAHRLERLNGRLARKAGAGGGV